METGSGLKTALASLLQIVHAVLLHTYYFKNVLKQYVKYFKKVPGILTIFGCKYP